MSQKIVILGGGISGLSTGYFLSKRGYRPIILEKEKDIGGLGSWYNFRNIFLDKAYHIIFPGDEELLKLLKELKLEKNIVWGRLKFEIIQKKGSVFLSSPFDVMKSNLLTIEDKIKLFCMHFKVRNSEWKELDNYLAKDWIIKHGSINIYNTLFEPLIRLKWGSDDLASAAWLFGRIKPRSGSINIFAHEKAGYLRGSFKELFHQLRKEIENCGGKILTNAEVSSIDIEQNKVKKITSLSDNHKKEIYPDVTISTIPVPELIKISNFPGKYRNKLSKIKYVSVICACFLLKKRLTRSYRTIINKKGIPFGGIVELTSLVSPKIFNGYHVVYVFNFLDVDDSLWKLSDNDIIETYVCGLNDAFPDSDEKNIVWVKLHRNKYGEPIYEKNYLDIMPKISTPIKDLFITGIVQSYPISDFNNIIKLSTQTSNLVEEYLKSQ